MKLLYLTIKRFEKVNADTAYITSLAKEFGKLMKDEFILTMSSKPPKELKNIETYIFHLGIQQLIYYISLPKFLVLPVLKLTYGWFILQFPFLVLARGLNRQEQIIFSNDFNLLAAAIFFKKKFFLKYRICSDWHMLFENSKDKYIAENSDFLITTSEKLKKNILTKFNIDEKKIAVVYGGIELNKFLEITKEQAREKLNLPKDKKLIGYMGLFTTLRMEKGIGTMVKALNYLNDNMNMVLVGRREREGVDYDKLAKEIEVGDRCIIKDFTDYDRMILYEQAMDILIIPYPDQPHFRNYGFPMKVYEYMAAKRPIIYSRLELTEEILADCGFTFKPDDADDLARTIRYVFENKDEAEKKTEIAFSKLKDLTWEKKAEKIINFINK